jgi:lipopolysaccharide/colanic/teichoic acid biosynthesis glycosyltransferase
MSIVGRPLPVYEAELITGDLSKGFSASELLVLASGTKRERRKMSENEKNSNNEYADQFTGDNYSFWYDIKLILRTIPALLQKGPFKKY